ncbi:hypothetical protein MTX20_02070 [Bradyrhizobium sp. ISRA435]|nr:hypothetical protein MTX20_02070 [Bradyrhizobium sp. ISRA435]
MASNSHKKEKEKQMTDKMTNSLSVSELESCFSEDYFYFGDVVNPPETSDRQVGAIWGASFSQTR